MTKCNKCSNLLEVDAKFCTSCGEKVSDEILKEMEKETYSTPKVKTKIEIFGSVHNSVSASDSP